MEPERWLLAKVTAPGVAVGAELARRVLLMVAIEAPRLVAIKTVCGAGLAMLRRLALIMVFSPLPPLVLARCIAAPNLRRRAVIPQAPSLPVWR